MARQLHRPLANDSYSCLAGGTHNPHLPSGQCQGIIFWQGLFCITAAFLSVSSFSAEGGRDWRVAVNRADTYSAFYWLT